LLSSHITPWFAGIPPTHTPAAHISPAVHALLSLQAAPSFPGTATHVSVASLQLPIMHTSPGAAHVFGIPPHDPAVHLS
jgi:hypothetical protein